MQNSVPLVRDVVLVGGGHTHALVLRAWGMNPVPGARLTLVHPAATAPYSGMLPGHIAGHYARDDLEIDMVRLARFAGARLIPTAATGLDPARKVLSVEGRCDIAYDILSLDIGVTAKMPETPGFAAHGLPAKPLGGLAEGWARFCDGAATGARVVVIGGGVAGAELAMAAAHRLRDLDPTVTVIDRGNVLVALPPRARARMRAAMAEAGIEVIEGMAVAEVTATAVRLQDGRDIAADCVIGAAGAHPHAWIAGTGLTTEAGYLTVDRSLRSVDDPSVYAAGDCAHLAHAPRPKAGVFAVRAAPILTHNLRADLTGGPRRSFRPQRDYLKLVSLGRKAALGEKAGLVVAGAGIWRWKDWIDRRFMYRVGNLPAMKSPAPPPNAARGVAAAMGAAPPCGGCGAKIGAGALAAGTGAVRPGGRADVVLGMGDDAAILKLGGARQALSTDHLRGFAEDPALVARVAALHAMGDIWAMRARPQVALAQVILPRMAEALQTRTMSEVMAAASDAFAGAGAEIVGGHSSEGAELSVGFTVTGVLDRAPLSTAGARPGDALILSRPLGTGILLAAEMAGRARGADILELWDLMATPQGDAAEILAE
ncbi:MAG: selenide, water dikinase SelD, partial [Pseudomonadota bacterium]